MQSLVHRHKIGNSVYVYRLAIGSLARIIRLFLSLSSFIMVFTSLPWFLQLLFFWPVSLVSARVTPRASNDLVQEDQKILILGGGVGKQNSRLHPITSWWVISSAGVIAARTLHEQGFENFVIIEARNELGGRMMSRTFGIAERQHIIELGANWVQGYFLNFFKWLGLKSHI